MKPTECTRGYLAPKKGDVLSINCKAPAVMEVLVRECLEFLPGQYWQVKAKIMVGKGAGKTETWTLYNNEFTYRYVS